MEFLSPDSNNLSKRRWIWPVILLLCLLFCSLPAQAALVDQLKEHPAAIRGEDLKVITVLRAIGRQAGLNIFVNDTIIDTISIEMENLTLFDIFHVILNAKKLSYYEKDQIIYVEKQSDFQLEDQSHINKNICTKFGNAGDYIDQLRPMVSKTGSISTNKQGNCLVVRDRQENVDKVTLMISQLDQAMPQVHIEARIVSISNEAKRRLGIKWGYDNLSTRNPITAQADLAAANTSSLTLGFIRDNLKLNFELQALQEDNKLHILSSPRILVMDGKEAEIKQGKEVPYVTQSSTMINTSFREANLSLKVTPRILQDSYIVLDVKVTNDSVDQTSSGTEPLINKQEISTKLFLEDKVTVVIGGIVLQTNDNQVSGVPGLAGIPLLGNLFKSSEKVKDESELLVFITPSIVKLTQPEKAGTTSQNQESPKPVAEAKTSQVTGAAPLTK